MSDVEIDRAALARYINTGADSVVFMRRLGNEVRDEARRNAGAISDKTDAIVSEMGADAGGIFTDVGYAKHHPGFFLWWWEVGTQYHAPRPHLRPALRPRL